jgi:two-component system, cell cycle sensor histidine kinase and response regulator CckA
MHGRHSNSRSTVAELAADRTPGQADLRHPAEDGNSKALWDLGIALWDLQVESDTVIINRHWATLVGRDFDTLTPFTLAAWAELIHPDDLDESCRWFERCCHQSIDTISGELRLRHGNGHWLWVQIEGRVLARDQAGTAIHLHGIMLDISRRKAAEADLRESEQRFRALVEYSQDGIARFDRDLCILYVNQITADLYGIDSKEALVGQALDQLPLSKPLYIQTSGALRRAFATGQPQRMEILLPSGHWLDWMVMPEMNRDGAVEAVMTAGRDITERKQAEVERLRLEEQLRNAQRIEAVGRLAGGIAHDFNNILNVILGHCELAMLKMTPYDAFYSRFEGIQAAARRSTELTRQLLAFARKQTITPRVLDLNQTVEGTLKILHRLIGEDIHIAWTPTPDLWTIRADPSQIDQILTNLCVNARDAIVGVGTITIELANRSFDRAHCLVHGGFMVGDFVMLAIRDNGCGMSPETQDNLFDPFYTTKEVGKGTGLGLATVYGIVKQNSGFVDVTSAPDQGSTFTIYLPRDPGDHPAEGQSFGQDQDVAGHETILLVEDEGDILEIGQMMLENLGYRVLTAASPGQALRLAEHHGDTIDLLITDVIMPEMNGHDLAERLQQRHPHLRVLYMSGYTADVIAHHGVLDDGVHFINKPFSIQELGAMVRQSLDNGN